VPRYAFEAGDYSSKKVLARAKDAAFVATLMQQCTAQVTIYITLASVGSLPKESVKVPSLLCFCCVELGAQFAPQVEFQKRSLDLQASGRSGMRSQLAVLGGMLMTLPCFVSLLLF
jgi:hypothetical protein